MEYWGAGADDEGAFSSSGGLLPPIADPYPDPGDYRGKAQPFTTNPTMQGRGGADGTSASAAPVPVLTTEDHEHFLRTGFIHLKGVIPLESVAETLENIQQPRPDCTRLHAAIRELLGPHYSLDLPTTSGGYDMPRALLSPTEQPAEYAAAVDGSSSTTVVTQGRAHCDDAYGTLMPQGWVLGSFIFLTPVESRGGAFIVYPGSYLRYRDAMGAVGPGGYKGIAPEFGGDLMEVLAEPGDAVIFHHLMGHSGSHNVASLHTRHALLNRYHPSTRLAPPPDRTLEEMSTLERANSARYLQRSFGIGRCLSPSAAPVFLQLPQLQDQPVYTAFFLYGFFQLWVVPAQSPCSLLRYVSEDLQIWTQASSPVLPEMVTGMLSSGSKIVDLQFHHYDLEAIMSLCVVDADGKNDRCLLFESLADDVQTTDATLERASSCGGGRWRAIGTIVGAGISKIRPFNAYAGYPSEVAVGQVLYHVRADRPNELRCSWSGPVNRIGGNGPADGEWQPVVEEVCSAATTALEPNYEERLDRRNWCGEKTTIALRTEDSSTNGVAPAGSVHAGAAVIADVTVAARWGDSACSFVLDLESEDLDPSGAHYALPADIALVNPPTQRSDGKGSRALENPDQILAEETESCSALWPLRIESSPSTSGAEQQTWTNCVATNAVWRVRVLMRARSFWLVSYLTCKVDGAGKRNKCWQVEIGTIDWATDVPAVVRPVDTKAKLQAAFAIVGWA